MKLNQKTELITPACAKAWLGHNYENNRCLNKATVEKYARDMIQGKWECNGGGNIVIDEDGVLKDGQHRLAAIVMANRPIYMTVTHNSPRDSRMFDVGRKRTSRDIFKFNGSENSLTKPNMSSIINLYILHFDRNYKTSPPITISDTESEYMKDQKTWDMVCDLKRKNQKIPAHLCVVSFCALKSGIQYETIEKFVSLYKDICPGIKNSELSAQFLLKFFADNKDITRRRSKEICGVAMTVTDKALTEFIEGKERKKCYRFKKIETRFLKQESERYKRN